MRDNEQKKQKQEEKKSLISNFSIILISSMIKRHNNFEIYIVVADFPFQKRGGALIREGALIRRN